MAASTNLSVNHAATLAQASSKPAATRVRGVLLDAGNTMLFERPSRFEVYWEEALALGLHTTRDEMRKAMLQAHDRLPWVDGERVRYTDAWFKSYIPLVYQILGAKPRMVEGLCEKLLANFRKKVIFQLYPETLDTLSELKVLGMKLGVVSNWSPRLAGHLDRLGIAKFFDSVLISAVVGLEKPSPAIFERACRDLGIAPDETIHVGDHPIKDCAGARAAGIKPMLLIRDGEQDSSDTHTIRSLHDIVTSLKVSR